VGRQMADGGWSASPRAAATHGSLHTTVLVLEARLEYEQAGGRLARQRERRGSRATSSCVHRMFRSHRTGEVIREKMTRFSFPPQCTTMFLRGWIICKLPRAPAAIVPAAR